MKMKKTSNFLCAVLVLMMVLVTGCTGGSSSEASKTPADSTNPGSVAASETKEKSTGTKEVELFSQKPENIDIYNAIIEDFMAENPGIKIVQTTSTGGTNFVVRVASNDLPDIGTIYFHPTYKAMMDEGLFVDLSGEAYLDKINNTVVEMVKLPDGKIYVLPVNLNGYGLYYNKDIYDKYGLKAPTTIEELFANCEKLKSAGVTPFAFPFKGTGDLGQNFERFLGGAVDHEAYKISEKVAAGKSYKDFPEIRNYLEIFYKLVTEYSNGEPLSMGYDDVTTLFTNEKVAMVLNGTWGCSAYAKMNPALNYETVLVPTISGIDPTSAGTVDTALAISSSSRYIDECKAFLEFFVRDDIAQRFAEADKNPTAVKAVNYVIPHMEKLTHSINSGKFSLIPSAFYPAGFRDEIQVELQQYLLDGDVDAFMNKWDTITDEFYNKK